LLTRTQAENIAEDLLSQQRRAETKAKNAAARRVPFVYYVGGLSALEPWEQAELLKQAARRIGNQWKATIITLCLVAVTCLAWWMAGLFGRPGVSPVLLVMLCGAVAFLPRAYFVRQELRRLLCERMVPENEPRGEP
jgi:Flp pilus assembly protein TadB